ncbi:MAG: hypothetical protein HYU64_11490 [Armatimonadetes bacterium]|nr:hypothetical protein [Armatimonadota bacterium]
MKNNGTAPAVIGVTKSEGRRILWCRWTGRNLESGQTVVLKTLGGLEIARVEKTEAPTFSEFIPNEEILRVATPEDLAVWAVQRAKGEAACRVAQQAADGMGIPLQMKKAFHSLDNSRITFFFTVEWNADAVELSRKLAFHYGKPVELRLMTPKKALAQTFGCGCSGCCGNGSKGAGNSICSPFS